MADQDVERSSTGSVHSTGGMSLGEMEVVGRAKAWLAAVTASAVHAAYSTPSFMSAEVFLKGLDDIQLNSPWSILKMKRACGWRREGRRRCRIGAGWREDVKQDDDEVRSC